MQAERSRFCILNPAFCISPSVTSSAAPALSSALARLNRLAAATAAAAACTAIRLDDRVIRRNGEQVGAWLRPIDVRQPILDDAGTRIREAGRDHHVELR